jgi:hypothetical protein
MDQPRERDSEHGEDQLPPPSRFVDTDADIQIDPATLPENIALMKTLDGYEAAAAATRDPQAVRERVGAAFERFLSVYASFGGHNYHGWTDYPDPRNYKGPMFWSEGDCAYRLALELEREFPDQVHTELPVVRWAFADYNDAEDKRQFIDLVVSNMITFEENETSQARFTTHHHALFIEAKYFPAGYSRGRWRFDHIRKVEGVLADAKRLGRHIERGHCMVAAVFVVDDDDQFEEHMVKHEWPTNVDILLASPQELARRGIGPQRERA